MYENYFLENLNGGNFFLYDIREVIEEKMIITMDLFYFDMVVKLLTKILYKVN